MKNKINHTDSLVTRSLKLNKSIYINDIKYNNLSKEPEFKEIKKTNKNLIVTYNNTEYSIDSVIEILKKYNIDIDMGPWSKVKLGFFRFFDQNIKDNINHKSSCCNKPPKQ